MARSYSVSESSKGSPSISKDLELAVLKERIKSRIEDIRLVELKSKAEFEKVFKEKADSGVGFASAYAKELQRIEALQKDPEAKFENERDGSGEFAMKKIEDSIKEQDYETAVIFDRYGRFISKSEGGKSMEANVDALESQMVGGTLTHNHPKGGSPLSVADVYTLLDKSLGSIRAVSKKYGTVSEIRYTGEIPPNARGDFYLGKHGMKLANVMEKLKESWNAVVQDASSKVFFKVKKEDQKSYFRLLAAGNAKGFRLDDPSIADIMDKYYKPAIEKQWMEFVAGELEQFGFEYYHDGKKV